MAAITAAAIAAGGVLGAAKLSSNASKAASKAASKGQASALGASGSAAAQAAGDVNRLFGTAADARNQGFQRAIDFTAGSIPQQIEPFQQGNLAAQQQLGQGLQQQQNALFGGPVDLSGFQARQIGQPQDFALNIPQAQPQASSPVVGSGFRNQFVPNQPPQNIFGPNSFPFGFSNAFGGNV